jgi:beta-lactamase regulating signal transducer with metallopeptidase domain
VIRSLLEFVLSPHFALVLLLVKISIVFGMGFLLAHFLRHRSAAVRHFVWVTTLLGALAVPLATRVAPQLEWPILSPLSAPPINSSVTLVTPTSVPSDKTLNDPLPTPSESQSSVTPILSVTRIWLAGALLVAIWCAIGHLALWRLSRRARPVTDAAWLAVLEDASRAAKLGRPVRLLASPAIDSPMTWGFQRPIVLLPESASEWTLERRRVVLLHELAHIARKDFMVQLVASFTCALYWFHPGAWGAARRLRHESERACDDRAIASGTPAADYASHLLSLALQSKARHWHEAMAIGLTRSSTLEARVRAALDENLTRRALSPRVRVAGSIVLGAFVLLLSALTPVRAALYSAVVEGPPAYREPSEPTPSVEIVPPVPDVAPVAALENTIPVPASEDMQVVSRSVLVEPGERLDLRLLAGGNVDIEGWDEPLVRVRSHIKGPDADKIKVDVDRTPNGVQVNAYFAEHSLVETASNDFEIHVPRKFDLRLHSSGGGLRVSNVEGTFEGDTGGGEIVLDHVKGHASLSTGGSDIRVTDSHLDGEVSTGGGTVDLIRVKGGLVGSSGSGPVMSHDSNVGAEFDKLSEKLDDLGEHLANSAAALADRPAEISKSGGGVTLDEIPRGATISTGGGDVEIGRTAGPVVVSTGGGDMEIGPVNGSLDASTGAGDIQVRVAARDETIDLTSGSGKITLELPASFDGRIDLESGYTKSFGRAAKIDSEWKLTRESTTDWDDRQGTPRRYVRGHAILGEGRGRVRVTTVNGDIVLRRAKQ